MIQNQRTACSGLGFSFLGARGEGEGSNSKNHPFPLFQTPQRTGGFHERADKEPAIYGRILDFFKTFESHGLYIGTSLAFLKIKAMNPKKHADNLEGPISNNRLTVGVIVLTSIAATVESDSAMFSSV